MAWFVDIAPEVSSGIKAFGLGDPDLILKTVIHNLNIDESSMSQRWILDPENYFVYVHSILLAGRLHSLEFIVNDAFKAMGVLRVVWVEHIPGLPYP